MSRAADRAGGNGSRNGGVPTSKGKKRKMVSEDWSPSGADGASRRPPKKKLLHDAMPRKHREQRTSSYCHEATGSTDARCHAEKRMTCHDYKFGGNQQDISDALLVGLSEHGASAPWFVDRKQLKDADAKVDQNRLQFPRSSPISQVFTPAEKARIKTDGGLMVMAFDRRGKMYSLKCRFFSGKSFCRLMGKWGDFLRDHRLAIGKKDKLSQRVILEVWAFRSVTLPNCTEDQEFDCGHPDGALVLVVLHREEGEAAEHEVVEAPVPKPDEEAEIEDAEEEEEEAAVVAQEHIEQTAASVQEEAGPAAKSVQVQEVAPAMAMVVQVKRHEEVCAEPRAVSYESKLLHVAAAMLLVLRTSDRTRSGNAMTRTSGKWDLDEVGIFKSSIA